MKQGEIWLINLDPTVGAEIIREFGSKARYLQAVKELENELYKTA